METLGPIAAILGYLFAGISFTAIMYRLHKRGLNTILPWSGKYDADPLRVIGIGLWPMFLAFQIGALLFKTPTLLLMKWYWLLADGHPWKNWQQRINRT